MIFLGDQHSYNNYKRCDVESWIEAKLEFFDILNDFGNPEKGDKMWQTWRTKC